MPALPEGYVRKGTLVYFQMDNDALSMLKEVAPTTKSYGRYLSELVRRDYALRQQWAKALLHLGQLVRTIYLLRYFNDPVIRQQVRTQLNRGEARQDLAQRLFFADQGMFRSGDYYQMMNRASCLSLLSNAVLVYNTWRIGHVLERANTPGQAFSSEAIAHIFTSGASPCDCQWHL